jgi:spore maturation protein CgeB
MKNYRIVRLAGIHYPDAIQSFLDQNPDYSQKSYDAQLRCLFQESPMYSDGFSRSFRNLGQEAFELIFDFEILQKQWAKENGIQYNPENWILDIMIAQITVLKPDVIFFQGTELTIPGRFVAKGKSFNLPLLLKEKFSFLSLIVMYSGYPCAADRLKGIDILFAGVPSLVKLYKRMGSAPILLYHSFDESIVNKLQNGSKKYGFTFVGAVRAPETRYWALKQLLDETNIEMWIYEQARPNRVILNHKLHSLIKKGAGLINTSFLEKYEHSHYLPDRLRNFMMEIINEKYYKGGVHIKSEPIKFLRANYPERCHTPVMGMDMYNLLHQSKITFNKHTDAARGDVGNMRMFEATGVGSCLITDTGNNMGDLFEEDKEVVIYKNIDEAVEKVNYLMEHKEVAAEIAKAGQKRTFKDHSTKARCQQIDDVIQKNL